MFFIILIIISTIGYGQTSSEISRPFRIGFGLALPVVHTSSETMTRAATFYMPIDFARFRIEPTLSHRKTTESSIFMGTSAYHENIIGAGLFLKSSYNGTSNYYGFRSGLGKLSSRYNLSSQSTTLSFWALVVGGEHLFSHSFSLGGEAQLRFEEGKNSHSWRNKNYTTEEIKLSVILRFMI